MVAGITYRQLDYWARTELTEPSIREPGGGRLYSKHDVLLLRVLKLFLDAGVSLQVIRVTMSPLRRHSLDELARITLMSDGSNIYEATSDSEIVDIVKSGRGIFGLDLGQVVAHVRRSSV